MAERNPTNITIHCSAISRSAVNVLQLDKVVVEWDQGSESEIDVDENEQVFPEGDQDEYTEMEASARAILRDVYPGIDWDGINIEIENEEDEPDNT